ncbi:hypothetical protein PGIGA_G00125180, partial [Pangasianodon gigas]|nr:hypothetical protein [Pangasianodon gigas]
PSSPSLSPLLYLAGLDFVGRSDQNKNSNTRHRREGEKKRNDPSKRRLCPFLITLHPVSLHSPPPPFLFSPLFRDVCEVVISSRRIKPADLDRAGAFWGEMTNRMVALLLLGSLLLTLLQPSLQGGVYVPAGTGVGIPGGGVPPGTGFFPGAAGVPFKPAKTAGGIGAGLGAGGLGAGLGPGGLGAGKSSSQDTLAKSICFGKSICSDGILME